MIVTINNENVQDYIDKGLIDPNHIIIDLNTSKTTSNPERKAVKLSDAIKAKVKFNFDYDAKEKLTNPTQLPEIEVTASKPKDDIDFKPRDTEQNLRVRDNTKKADKIVAETSAFQKPLNFLSPSQWFGAYINYRQGEYPFWKGIYDGNSGWVPDQFAYKYPRASVLLNMLGDGVFGKAVSKIPGEIRYLTEPIEYEGAESRVVTRRISPYVTKYSNISPADAHTLN